ncbi:HAD-IA family hydrolase [Megamonas hypermegale]|uniref:HAD-IA family hydrolase n=2 Tax=Megamonas hypermegale TaxID=158847 RepID=UPI0032085318
MYNKLLSVIVTVYNTEKYLSRCLDSILECSYDNLEIIVVDDKSPGNIDEIMEIYKQQDKRIKYIKNKDNKGLYCARIIGVENSKGDYIAFLDSDDHVSVDFYRKLIKKAEETDSDMVIGEYILEYDTEPCYKYQNFAHTRVLDIDVRNDQATELLFKQCGRDFSLHVVWNKIYSRELWNKCYPYLKKQTQHLIMCEDVLFSSLFFYFANHITNIHNDFVYYTKREESSTGLNINVNKCKKNIYDIELVFNFLKNVFEYDLNDDRYKQYLDRWKNYLMKVWKNIIQKSNISLFKKKNLIRYLDLNKDEELTLRDNYFYLVHTDVKKIKSEELKKKILNPTVKIISFDVFDTLIVRPFLYPTDVFNLLEIFANETLNIMDKISFKNIRVEAEKLARQKSMLEKPMWEDITLDDIYIVVKELTNFSEDIIEKIKNKEIELELKYCKTRNFAKELFELALSQGKRIIITSDMYLSKDIIKEILNNNGYNGFSNIYVSSEIKLTKSTGNLFNYIAKELNIPSKQILHIGDNYFADVENAKKSGWQSYHLPKCADLLMNKNLFKNIYEKSFTLRRPYNYLEFLGIRVVLGMIANKMFDNPYIIFNENSDFNADTRIIGYYALGTHLFAISHWLIDEVKNKKYDNLNFMARDGYLPMEGFKLLNKIYNLNVNVNYIHLTRSAILPLQINSFKDMYSLEVNMNIYTQSPKKIINILSSFIDENKLSKIVKEIENEGFIYEERFKNVNCFYQFINWFNRYLYNENYLKSYKREIEKYLRQKFYGKTATFDIGYSCRIESALKANFGFDITPYYIHINNDIPLYRSNKRNISVNTFYQYSPGVTGVLRELLISKLEPSCKELKIVNDKLVPVFKDYKYDYYEEFIIGNIQKNALNFVKDMVNIFDKDIETLFYQREDISLIHEYLSSMPKYIDRQVFAALEFEDDLGIGKTVNLLDFWNKQISEVSTSSIQNQDTTLSWVYPLWVRSICLYFLNRNLLKQKVNERWKQYPIRLNILKKTYRFMRCIYRKF